MEHLDLLLGGALDGNEPHVGMRHRLANGLGVIEGALRLEVELHELRTDDLDRMPHLLKFPGPGV